MTDPNRFAVPAEDLDEVHVAAAEQVFGQPPEDLRWAAGGALVHPYGDGLGQDADGD
jgi:hypothetical protein